MTDRIRLRLPEGFLARVRLKAVAQTRALASLIEEGLRLPLTGLRKRKYNRILPTVSQATGGPMPGIDITDSSVLQEMDDLELVARSKL
jgi:hypothetical protein